MPFYPNFFTFSRKIFLFITKDQVHGDERLVIIVTPAGNGSRAERCSYIVVPSECLIVPFQKGDESPFIMCVIGRMGISAVISSNGDAVFSALFRFVHAFIRPLEKNG